MRQRYMYNPFAVAGDQIQVAMAPDSGGGVSYDQGWTPPYQDSLSTNPAAKAMDRERFNSVMYDITLAIQGLQQYGCPEWIDATDNQGTAFPYDVGAVVLYSASGSPPFTKYVSLATANTTTPGATSALWQVVPLTDGNAVTVVAANKTLTSANCGLVQIQNNTTALTITIPTAVGATAYPFYYIENTSTINQTVTSAGGNFAGPYGSGGLTQTLAPGDAILVMPDGTNWQTFNFNNAAFGIKNREFFSTVSGNWTSPITGTVFATLVGGGGGGGAAGGGPGSTGGAGGGGGGIYIKQPVNVVKGTVYAYTVGSGGSGGIYGGAAATAGTSTTFNGLTATGGNAGGTGSISPTPGGAPSGGYGQAGYGTSNLTFGGAGGGHLLTSGTPGGIGLGTAAKNAISYGTGGAGSDAAASGGAGQGGYLLLEF